MAADPLKAIFGGSKAPSEEAAEPVDGAAEESSELPPGFQDAFDEYQSAPSADALYRLIEMCKDGGGVGMLLGTPSKAKK